MMNLLRHSPKAWASAIVIVMGGIGTLVAGPNGTTGWLMVCMAGLAGLFYVWIQDDRAECRRELDLSKWRFFRLYYWAATEMDKPKGRRRPLPTIEQLSVPLRPEEAEEIGIKRI